MTAADDDDVERLAHAAARLTVSARLASSSGCHVSRPATSASGSFARSSARRRSRIASRSGSAASAASSASAERVALRGERLHTARAEAPPVRGIRRHEVPLGDHVGADETRDPGAEERFDERGAAAVVIGVVIGVRDVGDVVHEAGDGQLRVVRVLDAEDRTALERVRQTVERRARRARPIPVRAARGDRARSRGVAPAHLRAAPLAARRFAGALDGESATLAGWPTKSRTDRVATRSPTATRVHPPGRCCVRSA